MRAANAPELMRLRDVGMYCGCEYTSFPRFSKLPAYSRWQHSLGVALIVWRFTGDPAQALAGLLHDIATPTFAHVIDFLRDDHMTQEATEDGTREIIAASAALQTLLSELGLTTEAVCDYHRYPIADNDSPRLSADRLEYTLSNAVNYSFCSEVEAQNLYDDLRVDADEAGAPELAFQTPEAARAFAEAALQCGRVYVSDADRYAMQALAMLLKAACAAGAISEADFAATEPVLIEKLCRTPAFAEAWRDYRALREIEVSDLPQQGPGWLQVRCKKRYIDPLVMGRGRVSRLFPEFGAALGAFRAQTQNYWMLGK